MISLNRGEWSELYSILFLLVEPNLKVVDSNLNPVIEAEELFVLKEIISNSKVRLRYELIDNIIMIFIDDDVFNEMSIEEIRINRNILLDKIKSAKNKTGAFTIPSLDDFLKKFSNQNNFKTGSNKKNDIELVLLDKKKNIETNLTYSIKSSLGNPATILNSSSNTNFRYKVENLDTAQVNLINKIDTRTKLIDRIKKISELGGKIIYDSIPSKIFEYNLKMVDANMPKYLGNALLYSYKMNNKDLKTVFIKSNEFDDEIMAIKKLGDLVNAISFGFFPGKKWDGKNSVTGGLMIVKDDGNVCVIDLMYYKDEVQNYLIKESKLDSPSSTRYHMLELSEEDNGNIYFTLNLQIRYKN